MSHPLFHHFPAPTNHPLPARPVHPSSFILHPSPFPPRYYDKSPNEANFVVTAQSAKTCVSIPQRLRILARPNRHASPIPYQLPTVWMSFCTPVFSLNPEPPTLTPHPSPVPTMLYINPPLFSPGGNRVVNGGQRGGIREVNGSVLGVNRPQTNHPLGKTTHPPPLSVPPALLPSSFRPRHGFVIVTFVIRHSLLIASWSLLISASSWTRQVCAIPWRSTHSPRHRLQCYTPSHLPRTSAICLHCVSNFSTSSSLSIVAASLLALFGLG